MYVRYLLPVIVALLLSPAWSQQPNLEPNSPSDKPVPTVGFEIAFSGATPAHYAVAVESSGRAAYRSDDLRAGSSVQQPTGVPYVVRFTISDATRSRIFALAKQAKFFKGNFDYTKTRVANTGTKTLRYGEGSADSFTSPTRGEFTSTTYNYSENPAIQQLTAIFQSISSTLELGRRLESMHRYERLGLDEELKNAEQAASDHQLVELDAIAPALQAIAQDPAVLHIARERAQHLLKLAASGH